MRGETRSSYEFGPFRLNSAERVLLRDGNIVPLTPKAFETLLLLVQNRGHVVHKDELMQKVWPDTFVEEVNLAKNISALRRILGEGSPEQRYIETIPKRGYRFVASVSQKSDDEDPLSAPGNGVPLMPGLPQTSADTPIFRGHAFASSRHLGILLAFTLVLVSALSYILLRYRTASQPEIHSLAVLPLTNLSGDPAQEYFVDGMTEALINELAKIGNFRVTSRTSIMQYKGTQKSLAEIGRKLNVDAVVEGSVQRSGERMLITVRLIHAATDTHLWVDSYQRDLRDFLALQGEVCRAIAGGIKVKLPPREQDLSATARPISPQALDAYLKGRDYFNQGLSRVSIKEFHELLESSIGFFEQSVRIDPNFALAYVGLARASHWRAGPFNPQFYQRSKEAAVKALQIDETLAEAHAALAYVLHVYEWDWAGSEREYQRALELNPSYSDAHHGYALYLSTLGRHEEAIREIHLAEELDPLTVPVKGNIGLIYLNARQYDRAIEQYRRVLNIETHRLEMHGNIGLAYIYLGRYDEGFAEFRKAKGPRGALLAWAYAVSGNRREAIKILDERLKPSQGANVSFVNIAQVYTALGEKEQAFAWLEKALEKRSTYLFTLNVNPAFDSLRSDPRLTDILRRVGLTS